MEQSASTNVPQISLPIGGLLPHTSNWVMLNWVSWIGSETITWSMIIAEIPKDSMDRCLLNASSHNSKHQRDLQDQECFFSFNYCFCFCFICMLWFPSGFCHIHSMSLVLSHTPILSLIKSKLIINHFWKKFVLLPMILLIHLSKSILGWRSCL